jgi:hypothetical protein
MMMEDHMEDRIDTHSRATMNPKQTPSHRQIMEAAKRAYQEACAKLQTDEVVRVRDAAGAEAKAI